MEIKSVPKTMTSKGSIKNSIQWIFAIVLLSSVGLGFLNRQRLSDFVALYNYTPPASIVQLAKQDGLKPGTEKIFYVNHPEIQDKTEFKTACPNGGGEKTIILGCYHGPQNGIYLLKVGDPRLDGVTQVTAAHEVLHAAYDRLSSGERQKVNAMLTNYYKNDLKDERIKNTIEGYKKSEPKDVVNEMHSIFATEIDILPKDLDNYYSQYFVNRSKVTKFAAQYQGVFTSRQVAIKADDEQLDALKRRIEGLESFLVGQQSQINNRQKDLVSRRSSGDTAGYNAGVNGYNSLIDNYNQQVRLVQSLVGQYNQLVADRNVLASEISELSNALNTNAAQINQ